MGDTNRVEAFSDGVFAIAITLLVLEIKELRVPRPAVPEEEAASL
ncbi:TMEM175 family protein [Embleya sp. NBC_00896]|nr:TMEM175 family protein [Embleya sp. NBC_00896]